MLASPDSLDSEFSLPRRGRGVNARLIVTDAFLDFVAKTVLESVGRLETPGDAGIVPGLGLKSIFSRQCEVCIAFSLSQGVTCPYHSLPLAWCDSHRRC